jgi:hypothetical protein
LERNEGKGGRSLMTETPNLGLQKPGDNGILDIEVIDANMDIIDGAVAGKAESGHTHTPESIGALLAGNVSEDYNSGEKIQGKIENLTPENIGALYLVSASYGTTGYEQYSDGSIVQWGKVSSDGTKYFPISFPTACYGIVFGAYSSSGVPRAGSLTTSSFYYTSANFANTPAYWRAYGN